MSGSEPAPGPARGTRGAPEEGPEAVLRDLPVELWPELLRAFRRAAERLPRAALPARLRPFAAWKPERLTDWRPRSALASALAGDPRLREAVAAEVADGDERSAAAGMSGARLAAARGDAGAAALLAVLGRWEDLADLAARTAASAAAMHRTAAEQPAAATADEAGSDRARLRGELDAARAQRDGLRGRLADAERRAAAAARERDALAAEAARLRAEVERLEAALAAERDRGSRRLRKARRELADAEARARVDTARLGRVLADLEALGADLRAALEPGPVEAPPEAGGVAVPRSVVAAQPGRPCRLPAGLTPERADGVLALLQCPGIHVLVDGYNVTKHPRGRPGATLEEQRRWLAGVAGTVAARFRRRVTVAFDGAEPRPGTAPTARGVQVVFSEAGESADDLIVALLDGLAPEHPAMVVSGDRELCERSAALRADCVPVEPFLEVAGG